MIGALAGMLAVAIASCFIVRRRKGAPKTSSPTELEDKQVGLQPTGEPDAMDIPKPYETSPDREGQIYWAEIHSDAMRREQELHGDPLGRPEFVGSPPHFLHELEGQRS